MANFCDYEIHVKGPKKAALMLFNAMPCCDDKNIIKEFGTDEEYVVWMTGACKWSLDYFCKEDENASIDFDKYSEEDLRNEETGLDYWYLTMRQKSELFGLEILAHSWSDESDFDQMEHYKYGALISCDYAPVAPDWIEFEDAFDSYQDFCESFGIDPNQNPPLWDASEYPDYADYCEAFGIDPEKVLEEDWEEDDEDIYYYMCADKFGDHKFEFAF